MGVGAGRGGGGGVGRGWGGDDLSLYCAQSSWLLNFNEFVGFGVSLLWIHCGCRKKYCHHVENM